MSINFDTALKAHADWKGKLRHAIEEKEQLDAEKISCDDQCLIGEWLHNEAKAKFAGREDYQECLEAHARFHKAAGAVAKAINSGAYELALDMLKTGTEYSAASSGVALAIYEFRKHVEAQ